MGFPVCMLLFPCSESMKSAAAVPAAAEAGLRACCVAAHDFTCVQLTYQRGEGYDKPEGFQTMQQEIAKREGACDCETAGRLFYLAVPPSAYASIIANVKEHTSDLMIKGTEGHKSWVRVVIEKPFGKDLQTSKELSEDIAQYFTEEAVYRIDHYLGKELSQVRPSCRLTVCRQLMRKIHTTQC